MKKNKVMRLASVLFILALLSTCIISGTFAKYTTTVTGTGTAEIAKWSFTAGNSDSDDAADTFTLTLNRNDDSNVAVGKYAPGTSGSFAVFAKNDSETAAKYTATFKATNKPTNLKFYASTDGSTKGTELVASSDVYTIVSDQSLAQSASETKYVYWEWAFGDSAETDQSTIATGSYDMTVTVTVTGSQVD